jgi:hypothetical protein
MNNNNFKDGDLLSGFQTLKSAVIDSSSIIYMHKCDFLFQVAQLIPLHAPLIVIKEIGISGLQIITYDVEVGGSLIPADKQVVQLAARLKIPVISEDKKVLMEASKNDLPYYNSLMVLNFLLFKKKIVLEQYDQYHCKLLSVARYSAFVLSYGEKVKISIMEKIPLK